MIDVALVTARAAVALDEDLPPLAAALSALGLRCEIVCWDEPFDWPQTRLAVLRSTWDYMARLDEFLRWLDVVAARTKLLNPADIVRFSLDKHYLRTLADAGVAIIPTRFLEPGDPIEIRELDEFVVKPCVGAGSKGARRFAGGEFSLAEGHARALLDSGASVMVQPYLKAVDHIGEKALIYFNGRYSHAIVKGALLDLGGGAVAGLYKPESIREGDADADERAVADRALAALPVREPLAYARVDLIRAGDGSPQLLELELAEPSVFLDFAPGSAARFAAAIAAHLP
jgi:glutathione synthase/RimK-type ligase-like ATP-grasp enzyme